MARFRSDPNGNRVLIILPEGNVLSTRFDKRDLVFQEARGTTSAPPLAQMSASDPDSFDVRGGLPSDRTLTYDGNGNLIEAADADDTDLSPFAWCGTTVRARFGRWHRQERRRSCASHRECS